MTVRKEQLLKSLKSAYEGELTIQDIQRLKTKIQRVYAAIGYMLGHPQDYLTSELCVKGTFSTHLMNITGNRSQNLAISREAGLHKSIAPQVIMLTPPHSLGIATNHGLSEREIAAVNRAVEVLDKQTEAVIYGVYLRLQARYES